MLYVTIPGRKQTEYWDEGSEQFIAVPAIKGCTLQLEHSLVSLSKWESKWRKPFLSTKNMTEEESIDYVKCMTITQNVPDEVYTIIPPDVMKQITDYITAPMTATTFSKDNGPGRSREIVTAEIIDYWMISLNIPHEYRKWHLNKLMTLIRVCNIKNAPSKKMGSKELARRNSALNAARRAQHNSNG